MEELVQKLEDIWDEVGEFNHTRNQVLLEMQDECLGIFRASVDQRLHKYLADSEAELASLIILLGDRPVAEKRTGTLREQVKWIVPQVEALRLKKDERAKQIQDVKVQIEKLSLEISGVSGLEQDITDDLSLRKLNEYENQLRALQLEQNIRLQKVQGHVSRLEELCLVLNKDFNEIAKALHPSLDHSTSSQTSVSDATIGKLAKAIESLVEESGQRMEKLQDLAASLIEMWNLMEISFEERRKFKNVTRTLASSEQENMLQEPGSLGLDILQQAEEEVKRLGQLKISKMKELILEKQAELVEICTMECDANLTEEKVTTLLDSRLIDPSELLENTEENITKAMEESLSRKEITEKMEKWMAACEEKGWLEDYSKDESRFSAGRGAHLNLKRGERARVKLPVLLESLMAKTRAWEEERGRPFVYSGVPLLEMLENCNLLRKEKATTLLDSCLIDPLELLENIEENVTEATEEFLSGKKLMEKMGEEQGWLEDYSRDESRFSHLNLKLAERAPVVRPVLLKSLRGWEDKRGRPFLYSGNSLMEMLEKQRLRDSDEIRKLGNVYFKSNMYRRAVVLYTLSIQMAISKQQKVLAYTNRSEAYLQLHKAKKALEDAAAALQLDPGHTKTQWRKLRAILSLTRHKKTFNFVLAGTVEASPLSLAPALQFVQHQSSPESPAPASPEEFCPKAGVQSGISKFLCSKHGMPFVEATKLSIGRVVEVVDEGDYETLATCFILTDELVLTSSLLIKEIMDEGGKLVLYFPKTDGPDGPEEPNICDFQYLGVSVTHRVTFLRPNKKLDHVLKASYNSSQGREIFVGGFPKLMDSLNGADPLPFTNPSYFFGHISWKDRSETCYSDYDHFENLEGGPIMDIYSNVIGVHEGCEYHQEVDEAEVVISKFAPLASVLGGLVDHEGVSFPFLQEQVNRITFCS